MPPSVSLGSLHSLIADVAASWTEENVRLVARDSTTTSFNWTRLVIGLAVGGVTCALVFAIIRRRRVRREPIRIAPTFSTGLKASPHPTPVEVPRPPMMLRQPNHLRTSSFEPPAGPPPSFPFPQGFNAPSPAVHQFPTGPPNHHYPPSPPAAAHISPSSPPSSPMPIRSEPRLNHGQNAPAPAPASPPSHSPPLSAPPTAQAHRREPSGPAVSEMQQEIERLREENERIRAQAQNQVPPRNARQNTVENDAGPADAPPPYSPSNYVS